MRRGKSPARSSRRETGEPYSIVIPPPNVTGVLHMGHALNNTLQDVLIRYHRMLGKQGAVAAGDGPCRHRHADGGRARAGEGRQSRPPRPGPREIRRAGVEVERESGGAITGQLKRLGASCDWSRERFTLDEGLSKAVTKVFVELYQRGPDLSRQAAGELGPAIPDGDLGPRSRERGK